MFPASDLDHLERLVSAASEPIVLVFDADNTLVPQGIPVDAFQRGVTAAIERFESQPTVSRVIVLTNGPERGVPGMIHRGNKPWTTRKRLGLESKRETVWVVGDQILTDGVLAWRIGATYVLLTIDDEREAPRQKTMRRIGRAMAPLLFVS
jgi:predicted HAD superfamily phosphohydrolase YqeG